jgi:general secretion pathway protein F
MGTFSYRAVNTHGRFSDGRLEAPDKRAAVTKIEMMGLIPIAVEEPPAARPPIFSKFQRRSISRKDILLFTEELSTLVHAGLPLDRTLRIVAQTTRKAALRAVIEDILSRIRGGRSLAEAMASHPKEFSKLYVSMVRAGEAGGVLDPILMRLVEFERAADELRSYLITSLIYPCLLVSVGFGSIGVLLYFVIPKFATIFQDAGAAIPVAIMALLWVSDATRTHWWAVLVGLASPIFLVRAWLKTAKGRRSWDSFVLKLPFFGPAVLKIEVARFARTLGTLIESAVPLIAAVRIVRDIVSNEIVAEAISEIAAGAKRGEGVARPMRESGVFPDLAVDLVEVGEETGRLDAMLLQIGDAYDKDVRASVKALTSIFEPAIILVMGIVVGAVVLSMLMAIFSINEIGF